MTPLWYYIMLRWRGIPPLPACIKTIGKFAKADYHRRMAHIGRYMARKVGPTEAAMQLTEQFFMQHTMLSADERNMAMSAIARVRRWYMRITEE